MNSPGAENDDLVVLGRFGKPHGLRGEVRFYPYGVERAVMDEFPQVLVDGRALIIERLYGPGEKFWFARIREIESREEAAKLAGKLVCVKQAELPALPEMEFYEADLIGARMRNLRGEEFGIIEETLTQAEHDVLVVRRADGREWLVPALRAVFKTWDPVERLLTVDWDEPEEV